MASIFALIDLGMMSTVRNPMPLELCPLHPSLLGKVSNKTISIVFPWDVVLLCVVWSRLTRMSYII